MADDGLITVREPQAAPGDISPLTAAQRETLFADGFLAIPDMTDPGDIAEIRGLIEPLLSDPSLGARTKVRAHAVDGAEPVREILHVTDLDARLRETRFFRRAWNITEALFGAGVQLKFDHVIDKPANSNRATDWHQDVAYSSRVTRSAKRLHWWLPLQPVNEDNGCMQFVAGSHKRPIQRHWPVSEDGHLRATSGPSDGATVCPLPLGGATIHLPKTLHYSGPNATNLHRLAWIIQLGVTSWPTLL